MYLILNYKKHFIKLNFFQTTSKFFLFLHWSPHKITNNFFQSQIASKTFSHQWILLDTQYANGVFVILENLVFLWCFRELSFCKKIGHKKWLDIVTISDWILDRNFVTTCLSVFFWVFFKVANKFPFCSSCRETDRRAPNRLENVCALLHARAGTFHLGPNRPKKVSGICEWKCLDKESVKNLPKFRDSLIVVR